MRKSLYSVATNITTEIKGTPAYIILFVSDKCPNKCSHCWFNQDWKVNNLEGETLKLDEIENLSRHIKNVHFLSITGGEAFLRDDITEIVEVFYKNSNIHRFDIPSSGFDPDLILKRTEEILSKISSTPFRVDISLDGTEELHNEIRSNRSAFKNALETIKGLKRIKSIHNNFDLSIITTISEKNHKKILEISELIEDILPDGEWFVNLQRGDTPSINVSEQVLEAYIKANEYIANRKKRMNYFGDKGHGIGKWLIAKNSLRRDIIIDVVRKNRKGGGCWAGAMNVVILSNGDVRACELLPDSFGNLRDFNYDLPKMLKSHVGKNIRNKIQKTECICTHECNLSVNIMMQPSCWIDLLKYRIKDNL